MKDFILNSKNEYNSNRLTRVVVEEDAFLNFKDELRRKPKRKPEEDEILPNGWKRQHKKLRRMKNWEEEYEMHE